ncbi:hypothetical protein [Nonomuraea cavernae]|uniref:DprA winged helix domain-containing protein n=1 Tax=Nonomuraea cavernae TaxID=2045107 RepID=A0A917ZFQ5_9ACTN|nr:hypothetical protein [Nonomuraea cavernae]MCA2190787.1 hypothetical protein [Nonomuraea cavernae]GGO82338.1 hypothetical protein GCM10012289_73340 [Nonomuraea cavernae]
MTTPDSLDSPESRASHAPAPVRDTAPHARAEAHVRARSGGPLRLHAGEPAPAGMLRLTRSDSSGEALPVWPDGATPSLLDEYQVTPVPVERSGETRRVLAACLTCCWPDLSADPWPGEPAPVELVLDTYRALIGRTDDLMRNWAIGALRRLHDSAWIVMSDGLVSLGPRCALWPVESHAQLKELVHRIPRPERSELTVVADADLVAAARPPVASDPATSAPVPGALAPAGDPPPAAPAEDPPPAAPAEDPPPAAPAEDPPPAAPAEDLPSAGPGGRVEEGTAEFGDLLDGYDERRRAELVAAFMAVEHAAEPVQEARFGALRDPALRRTLGEMLARRGRTLIQHRERWISGYDDGAAGAGVRLGEGERAVLTLVLVHSVAIPRAEGLLPEDTWASPHPTPVEELRRHTQLPIGELEAALRGLRHAGLLTQVKAGEEAGGYVPGPQFHRLTPVARRRLQEELILAAGPHTPLAAAVRARRTTR